MTGLERAFRERGLLDRHDIFVFSDRWFRAGKVGYGLRGSSPSSPSPETTRGASPSSTARSCWLGKDGILVTTKPPSEATGAFGRYFARITPMGGVDVGRRDGARCTRSTSTAGSASQAPIPSRTAERAGRPAPALRTRGLTAPQYLGRH